MTGCAHDRRSRPTPTAPHPDEGVQRRVSRFLEEGAPALDLGLEALSTLSLAQAAALAPLPYDEAEFSARLLPVHLDPSTDQASRRPTSIRRQVEWLATRLPAPAFRSVVHPMCGPGLFADALVGLAETYLGIDIGPATIDHAKRMRAWPAGFRFVHGDVRRLAPDGGPHDLALITYETLGGLLPPHAEALVEGLARRSSPGGWLFAEVRLHVPGPGRYTGRSARSCPAGSIFDGRPHHLLEEAGSIAGGAVVGHRFIVVYWEKALAPRVYQSLIWTYSREALADLLRGCGYQLVWHGRPFRFVTDNEAASDSVFVLARRA